MPYEDESKRAARERLQARMERRGSSSSLASQRQSQGRSRRTPGGSDAPQTHGSASAGRKPTPVSSGGRQPQLYTPKSSSQHVEIGPLSFDIPGSIPPIALPIAIAIIVLLLIFALIVPRCSHAPEEQQGDQNAQVAAESPQAASSDAAATQAGTAATSSQTPSGGASQATTLQQRVIDAKYKAQQSVHNAGQVASVDKQESNQAALVELLGEENSAKLLAAAKTNIDTLWIAAHPSAFAIDGVEVQYKILKLAADEPEATPYVRNFPESYPAEKVDEDKSLAMSMSSPASNVPDTEIPHFYQWDRRWGYTTYSGAAFGMTGCGPTALAMVYQGLTGKTDKNPYDMGKLAEERGYMSEYEGTDGSFFIDIAEELGLVCEEIYPDTETVRQAIQHGQVVVANLGPGYFTTNGHYFVITGLTDEGEAIINDPYSVERSSQLWDLELIMSESYACYGYTKA